MKTGVSGVGVSAISIVSEGVFSVPAVVLSEFFEVHALNAVIAAIDKVKKVLFMIGMCKLM